MSKIYYANLDDVREPTQLMQDAYYKLNQLYWYLKTAINNSKEEINALGWREIEDSGKEKTMPFSHWVELVDPPSDSDVDGQVYQLFLRAMRLYLDPKSRGSYIEVLNRDFKNNQIEINQLPSSDTIYVHPNSYDLEKQLQAIVKLRAMPEKEYSSLLRLLIPIGSEDSKWPEFDLINVNTFEWEFLTADRGEGVENQRNFVVKALSTPDLAVLEGPPGSGKTTTVCELILQVTRRGGRVILCASTHVAIDNVLEKIKDHEEIVAVRIGDKGNIKESVVDVQIDEVIATETKRITKFLEAKRRKSAAQRYFQEALQGPRSEQVIQNIILESANLICGTSTGILQHPEIKSDLFGSKPIFDYLIIDEASKTTFLEFLVPAMLARKWILIGDPNQLSPYVDRGRIEGIIRTFLPYSDRRACQTAFWASRGVNSIIQTEDEEFIEKLQAQADFLDESVLDLSSITIDSTLGKSLALLSSRILYGSSSEIQRYQPLLPSDFGIFEVDKDLQGVDGFLRRQNWWTDEQVNDYAEKTWAAEIAWRLIRAFELRDYPDEVEKIEQSVIRLLPSYFETEEKKNLMKELLRIGFIALPSIIETLKEGYQFSKIVWIKYPSALERGIPQSALEKRYEILEYQHRMHPQISTFPRTYVYKEKALKDPFSIEQSRIFPYTSYNSRSEWIQVSTKEKMKQFNLKEVACLMEELKRFITWALKNQKQNRTPWTVAIITFYKAQEYEFLHKIREFTGQKANRFEFRIEDRVVITLGTVDSYQGQEADVVFLSFSRNKKVGFLNSKNRLNVALTRAKYQLVIIGDNHHFKGVENGFLLNDLAKAIVPTIRWSG